MQSWSQAGQYYITLTILQSDAWQFINQRSWLKLYKHPSQPVQWRCGWSGPGMDIMLGCSRLCGSGQASLQHLPLFWGKLHDCWWCTMPTETFPMMPSPHHWASDAGKICPHLWRLDGPELFLCLLSHGYGMWGSQALHGRNNEAVCNRLEATV